MLVLEAYLLHNDDVLTAIVLLHTMLEKEVQVALVPNHRPQSVEAQSMEEVDA